jgi:hypothetical protein
MAALSCQVVHNHQELWTYKRLQEKLGSVLAEKFKNGKYGTLQNLKWGPEHSTARFDIGIKLQNGELCVVKLKLITTKQSIQVTQDDSDESMQKILTIASDPQFRQWQQLLYSADYLKQVIEEVLAGT